MNAAAPSGASSAAPLLVIHGGDGAERRVADRLARAAGWRTRLASRPAELAKALDTTVQCLWLLDGDGATDIPERTGQRVRTETRAPGETIEHFVSRALSG